jgi:hypothetical protein
LQVLNNYKFAVILKKTISIFLVLTLYSQLMVKVGVIATWKFNQNYIAQNLCINRDKPEMECNGKCHLQKQLKSVENNQTKETNASLPLKLKNLKTDDFVNYSEMRVSFIQTVQNLILNSTLNTHYSFNYISSCFRPPQV